MPVSTAHVFRILQKEIGGTNQEVGRSHPIVPDQLRTEASALSRVTKAAALNRDPAASSTRAHIASHAVLSGYDRFGVDEELRLGCAIVVSMETNG